MQQFAGYDPANNPLNTNEWAFPVCEVFHILGFILLIGSISIVDFRMLGLGISKQTPAQLVKDTAPWTLVGLVMILITGPLIFSSGPSTYVYCAGLLPDCYNRAFYYKILMLMLAIIYNWTIHRKVAMTPNSPWAALVGGVSLLMWAFTIFAGIFIAFV
ncbi:MAG: hypothetical protein ABI824_18090 [Acidobacteriota bacterium]